MVVDSKSVEQLDVFLHNRKAGTLAYDGTAYQFEYDQEYLKGPAALPISLSLPLISGRQIGRFGGKDLPAYFFHLLPEGWLLSLAKAMKIPVNHPMEMLSLLVVETIGAIRISRHGVPLPHRLQLESASESLILDAEPLGTADFVRAHHSCLYCGNDLTRPGLNDNYHPGCAQDLFGSTVTPRFSIDREKIRDIAFQQLGRGESLTGVQEKFSLKHRQDRKTIAPPLSYFVAKPQPTAADLNELSNLEGCYTLFARLLGIPVAKSGIIYLADGSPCFISRRFDITAGNERIHQEDMAAPLGRYNKYEGSHEGIARLLTENATLSETDSHHDRLNFMKMTIFNFLLGNTDAHLKNFALFHTFESAKATYRMTPFYDIFPALLYAPHDTDELGLSLGNKKSKLKKKDFEHLARLLKLGPRTVPSFIDHFKDAREGLIRAMTAYRVSQSLQYKVLELARTRLIQIGSD